MEMHQIRYFLAVCDLLNFTRAAEKCNVSQPSLTRAVKNLEDELGGLLLRRERNQTHLTDLGQLMRPHLEQIFQEAETVKTTAHGFLKLQHAPVSLGVMCTIGPLRFVGFLAKFRQDHPGVELSLLEEVPQRLNEMLHAGSLDVAVTAQPTPFDERFNAHHLYDERFFVAFPLGHRFSAGKVVPIRDMEGEPYLSRINCEYYDQLSDLCREHNVHMVDAYRSEREDWIQTMVMAGMGICFLPEYSPVLPGLHLRPVEPTLARKVSLVTVAGRRFSPAVATFVRSIKTYRWPSDRAEAA